MSLPSVVTWHTNTASSIDTPDPSFPPMNPGIDPPNIAVCSTPVRPSFSHALHPLWSKDYLEGLWASHWLTGGGMISVEKRKSPWFLGGTMYEAWQTSDAGQLPIWRLAEGDSEVALRAKYYWTEAGPENKTVVGAWIEVIDRDRFSLCWEQDTAGGKVVILRVIYRRAIQRIPKEEEEGGVGGGGRGGEAGGGEAVQEDWGRGSFYGLLWNKVAAGFERPPSA